MPDLSYSSTNSIIQSWTCQQLVTVLGINQGYDVKAPKEVKKEEK